jgi:dTDP-4-amino-4,6-dideoxygalactose transaminase
VRVPLLDLKRQWQAIGPEVEAAALRVLKSGQYVLGPEVDAFEAEMAERMRLPHAIAVSSGSDALLVALWALGVGPGDEVVTTSLSFFATVGAIVRLGATPVFVDVEPDGLNLDIDAAARAVTARTKAIVPVHLFGRVVPLRSLVGKVPIVEDAAQAVGATGVCEYGVAATLSFFPSKNLGAAGDGGMVLTRDAQLADKIRLMRQHGSKPKYVHALIGGNFRIDALQAAILRAKLPHLDNWNRRRAKNATRLREHLLGTPLELPTATPGHLWHQYVVRAPQRDALREHLKQHEIDTEVYYPVPLHLQSCFAPLGYKRGDFPEAERACEEVLALPVHPDLDDAQLDFMCETIHRFYRS